MFLSLDAVADSVGSTTEQSLTSYVVFDAVQQYKPSFCDSATVLEADRTNAESLDNSTMPNHGARTLDDFIHELHRLSGGNSYRLC